MAKQKTGTRQEKAETLALKSKLEETEETLRAIRQYMVDAFVVTRESDTQVVTLSDAEFPYRLMVESMNEGAVTLIPDGTIFYCNSRFSEIVQRKDKTLVGMSMQDLIEVNQQGAFNKMLKTAMKKSARGEFCLLDAQGNCRRVQLSMYPLQADGVIGIAVIATDITERIQAEEKIRALASELTNAEQVQQLRISQVLHDDLQQRLFAVRAQLSLITETSEANQLTPGMSASLHQAQTWLSDAITVTRNLSVDISPSVLRGEGMIEAIRWLSSRMKMQHGLLVKLDAQNNLRNLPDPIRVTIFQAVRELLFNVVKHSGTLEATVTLEILGERARITITDPGKGFDAQTVLNDPQVAHGLMVIRDRLELMGGSMQVDSAPEKGTRISMDFPVEEAGA
ncbi:MAG: PAS domain S-box protein [Anaerolineales bacterium]